MSVSPYLFFEGCCAEAIDFYKAKLGAEVLMLMRYADAPPSHGPTRLPAGSENKIMHAALKIGTTEVMASDGMCSGNAGFGGFSLSLQVADVAAAETAFAALSTDGKVQQPLIETFFSPRFGMLTDKFGVGWIVVVQQPVAA